MAPDLPEKLLGITIDDADEQREESDSSADEEARRWFVFVGLGEHRLALPVDEVKTITEAPTDLTRVPRSPAAIEGVTDLRGDITAVVDPRVHFPVTDDESERNRLLVFDRPADQQSAGIRIDDVIGVEAVPERDVLDENAIEERDLSGDALEHPLVVAIVEQEREPDRTAGSVVATADGESGVDTGASSGPGGVAALARGRSIGSGLDSIGETFDIDADEEVDDAAESEDETTEIVVEATAVIDVDKLLLASGHGANGP
ncbi:chemotaxis protein CheW [Halosolutus amylolyticus]|uniref:Chemotaxis protein CheW n=1 Tax=Halosolutus amylolyticus TaxID=2932267 RepID=A0ABD5PSZ9_9EURY|nr:chemotaxis protein CheW [Halosolutus amylolyticus]